VRTSFRSIGILRVIVRLSMVPIR